MTYRGKQISWLEYRSQVTGKSVEELREEMRQRGALSDKSKSGFASKDPQERKKISQLGVQARKEKRGHAVEETPEG